VLFLVEQLGILILVEPFTTPERLVERLIFETLPKATLGKNVFRCGIV
jgi:hypothetical protein